MFTRKWMAYLFDTAQWVRNSALSAVIKMSIRVSKERMQDVFREGDAETVRMIARLRDDGWNGAWRF